MKIILQNKTHCIKAHENGIYYWHFYSGELELEDYLEAYNLAKNESNLLVLAMHDKGSSFSSDTWSFMTNKDTDFSFIKANAVVIDQLHLRILAKLFSRMKKQSYNIKIFSNKKDALKWLESFIL